MTSARETRITVMSTKGQCVLPQAIRTRRGWAAGTRLIVEDTAEGVLLRAAPVFPRTEVAAVFGALVHDGPAVSVEEMDAAVAAEARRRARD